MRLFQILRKTKNLEKTEISGNPLLDVVLNNVLRIDSRATENLNEGLQTIARRKPMQYLMWAANMQLANGSTMLSTPEKRADFGELILALERVKLVVPLLSMVVAVFISRFR